MAYCDLLDLWCDIYPQSGKDGADIRISAYDSYGFPSRFNYYEGLHL